jgi:RimJ/RimL family protein N-acetyltransferase
VLQHCENGSWDTLAMIKIETPRLLLRDWRDADLASFAALNADPVAMRHFPSTLSLDETRALQQSHAAHIAEHGFGAYVVALRSTGEFLGVCGCKRIPWPHALPTPVEIGWRFAPAAWGQGYATESARAALDHCFAAAKLSAIASFTVQENRPSWSVMERLGMMRRPDLDFDHPRVPDGHRLKRHIVYLARRG